MCLSKKHKKVEGEVINVNTLKHELEQDLYREDMITLTKGWY